MFSRPVEVRRQEEQRALVEVGELLAGEFNPQKPDAKAIARGVADFDRMRTPDVSRRVQFERTTILSPLLINRGIGVSSSA